jgi:hypothetical protein
MLTYREIYFSTIASSIDKLTTYLGLIIEYYNYLSILVEKKLLNNNQKFRIFTNKIPNFDFINKYPYPNYEDNIVMAR